MEASHWGNAFFGVVGFTVDFDFSMKAMEHDFSESFFAASDPRGADDWGEGRSEALAVGLVAGGAVSLTVEDFGTELIGYGIVTGKVGRSSDFDFWLWLDDRRRSEAFGGIGGALGERSMKAE